MLYAIGIEVAPRKGATFSLTYPPRRFDNINKASAALKTALLEKRGSCYGEVCSVQKKKDGTEHSLNTVRTIIWIPKFARNFTIKT